MALFLRRRSAATDGFEHAGVAVRRPHAGILRRERRDLHHTRAELIDQLGGLMVEMYRRGGDYREELLARICAQVVAVDERVAEIDTLLGTRRQRQVCACGTPVLVHARFCPNCGRAVDGAPALGAPPPPGEA
jgi:hypothetical protein